MKMTLDGTTGGTIPTNPDLTNTQIGIAGRTTDVITVTGKGFGAEAAQAFATPLTIDLANEYMAKIDNLKLESLTFVPSAPGVDFTVTVSQW